MAVYKVIQDVEAEDKLLGPLTLKQFIYAIISAVCIFINFKLVISTDLGILRWLFVVAFSMPMVLFAVLAAPLGRDQSTELWLLSHLKFMFSPRQRTWDQNGVVEGVVITAPKRSQVQLTKNLTQGEVKSRLSALATVLDSRGWAIQSTLGYEQPAEKVQSENDDRLVKAEVATPDAPLVDVRPGDDVLDESSNATAQRYGALVKEVEEQKKHALTEQVKAASKAPAKSKPEEPKVSWGVQNINPIAVIHPDDPGSVTINHSAPSTPADSKSDADLEQRLKAAETALHAQHPHYQEAESLAGERARRAERKLAVKDAGLKSNLASSDNFTVSTLAGLASRGSQPIKSMPL